MRNYSLVNRVQPFIFYRGPCKDPEEERYFYLNKSDAERIQQSGINIYLPFYYPRDGTFGKILEPLYIIYNNGNKHGQ